MLAMIIISYEETLLRLLVNILKHKFYQISEKKGKKRRGGKPTISFEGSDFG